MSNVIKWSAFTLLSVIVTSFLLWDLSQSGGETMYGCKFSFSANQTSYKQGDDISLKFVITPSRTRSVLFYEKLENTIVIYPLEHGQFRRADRSQRGEVQKYKMGPDAPVTF